MPAREQTTIHLGVPSPFHFEAENCHDFLEVLPDVGLGGGVSEQVGGMICGHEFSAAKIEPLAAKMRYAAIRFEQRLGGAGAEANDHLRRDDVELSQQEWRAGLDFVGFRQAVFRRATFYDVTDVNVFSLQAHRFDHLGEQFSSAADEGKTLCVFVTAGALTDEHEIRLGIPVAEDEFVSRAVQLAARAFAVVFADFQQGVVGDLAHGVK
jgi:hypothetical protein